MINSDFECAFTVVEGKKSTTSTEGDSDASSSDSRSECKEASNHHFKMHAGTFTSTITTT